MLSLSRIDGFLVQWSIVGRYTEIQRNQILLSLLAARVRLKEPANKPQDGVFGNLIIGNVLLYINCSMPKIYTSLVLYAQGSTLVSDSHASVAF